jgi:hypothetical protein
LLGNQWGLGMDTKLTNVMRLILVGQETYRVAHTYRGLRVRSGRAWLTLSGRDLVLKRGDEIALQAKGDYAVVSAVGRAPVVIELLGEAPHQSGIDLRPMVKAL